MKKIVSVILAFAMLFAMAVVVSADNEISVTVNGETIEFEDAKPIIEDDRVLVPVRAVFEKMGVFVDWHEPAGIVLASRMTGKDFYSVTLIAEKRTMEKFKIRNFEENVNRGNTGAEYDEEVVLPVAPKIIDSRMFIPLRAASEALNCEVDWDADTRTVIINLPIDQDENYVYELMSKIPQNENYVISPLSLKMAMMMLANGAEGDTKAEITKAFNIADLDTYNTQVKEMIETLNTNENGEVNIANSIWFNKDCYGTDSADFSNAFKETITENYKGTAETVTKKNSVEAVNEWVKEQTKGKITNLVPEANREYLAALVNAIYMKADWADPFTKEATYKETFTDIDGKETDIDFMHQTDHFYYYENGDTKIVRLPYTNGLSMYIALGDTKTFESDIENMTYSKVNLSIPKFKIEYSTELNDILKAMGVSKAFSDNNNDFDQMMQNVPDSLKIDTVLQKAIIEVDEKGTEAAAATAIMMGETMALGEPEPIVEFKADKPFTYYITDDASGETLFAGRYVKAE